MSIENGFYFVRTRRPSDWQRLAVPIFIQATTNERKTQRKTREKGLAEKDFGRPGSPISRSIEEKKRREKAFFFV